MRAVLLSALLALFALVPTAAWSAEPNAVWFAGWEQATGGKMVGAAAAAKLVQAGARVLDTRSASAFEEGHLPGSVRVGPERLLAPKSGALEWVPLVDAPAGLLVVGRMGGEGWWGEQGWLGMVVASTGAAVTVALVEPASIAAAAGVALERGAASEPEWLRFAAPAVERAGVVSLGAAVAAQAAGGRAFLDVRSRAEFDGAQPFGEARGGHIAGARWAGWEWLQGAPGWPLAAPLWRARMEEAMAGAAAPVVYCTGGVRSGFVAFALRAMGVDAGNFEGSMWAWSAEPTLPMEAGR